LIKLLIKLNFKTYFQIELKKVDRIKAEFKFNIKNLILEIKIVKELVKRIKEIIKL
jgi:hypothetical protein